MHFTSHITFRSLVASWAVSGLQGKLTLKLGLHSDISKSTICLILARVHKNMAYLRGYYPAEFCLHSVFTSLCPTSRLNKFNTFVSSWIVYLAYCNQYFKLYIVYFCVCLPALQVLPLLAHWFSLFKHNCWSGYSLKTALIKSLLYGTSEMCLCNRWMETYI